MVIRPETTLREIANAGGAARQLLDRWGIDFCCNGERSLRDACAHGAVDEVALERALVALSPAKAHDWPHEGLSALLDHVLGRCHPETRKRLAGRGLESVIVWAPTAGHIALGVTFVSYAGAMRVGVVSDAAIVADPAVIVADLERDLDALAHHARENDGPRPQTSSV